ncbi:hypothetical protein BaRGS_00005905, partial [Batillaria attramentaria]
CRVFVARPYTVSAEHLMNALIFRRDASWEQLTPQHSTTCRAPDSGFCHHGYTPALGRVRECALNFSQGIKLGGC